MSNSGHALSVFRPALSLSGGVTVGGIQTDIMPHLTVAIPEYLPGEPVPAGGALFIARHLLVRAALLALSLPLLLLWPLWLLLRLFLPRPPHVAPAGRFRYLLGRLLTARPDPGPAPGLTLPARLSLLSSLLLRWNLVALSGLAWHLDTLLYGRRLAATRIQRPLFELSAARSGSTQLARYIEADPRICAPNLMQIVLPYRWLWALVPATIGRLVTDAQVRGAVERLFPDVYLERHELDPFCTDTFEIPVQMLHLGDIAMCLGPDELQWLTPARITDANRDFWTGDFLDFIDAIGRKTLLHRALQTGGPPAEPPILMIKGHFLAVAPLLEQRYPDARFLTMIRTPEKRIQSVINFHRCQPIDPLMGALPWPWLIQYAMEEEPRYCDGELRWHGQPPPPGGVRCLIRFDDYLRDLEGTMQTVYRTCMAQTQLPPHISTVHAARHRTDYRIDRSLIQLSLPPDAIRARLPAYIDWCRAQRADPAPAHARRS